MSIQNVCAQPTARSLSVKGTKRSPGRPKPPDRADSHRASVPGFETNENPVYNHYLNSLAPTGRAAVKSLLNQCMQCLDHANRRQASQYPWQSLEFAHVSSMRAGLVEAGYAVATVNLAVSALRGLARTAFLMGKMPADELQRIQAIKRLAGVPRRKGRKLSKSEVSALLRASRKHPHKERRARDQALLMVALGAGLRASELVALELDDIDVKTGLVVVQQGKGRKCRELHVNQNVSRLTSTWIQCRGSAPGPLFTSIDRGGQPGSKSLTKAGLTAILDRLRIVAKISRFSPHDLRRTFISQLLDQGVDLNTVRQLAGHSDVSTTTRYDFRGEKTKKAASRALSWQ